MKKTLIIVVIVLAGALASLAGCSSFGGNVEGDRLLRVQASPNYVNDAFVNTVPQRPSDTAVYIDYLTETFFGVQERQPTHPIPVQSFPDASLRARTPPGLQAIWLGHASVYVEIDGVRMLIDPVFSDYASPFDGVGPKRFHATPVTLSSLPKIAAVLISHDHYDHLDMRTIRYLAGEGTRFFVPLGVGAHLDAWDVPVNQIVELDWGQSAEMDGLRIISTPSRHYSGREVFDYKKTFWSSWSVIGPQHRMYYSGDTGFSDHFAKTGAQYGPFDLSIIKVGSYGPGDSWIDIHMTPEDAVKAHLALRANRMLPVHWATFNLAFHDWDEPIKRTVIAAEAADVDLLTPRIGELTSAAAPNQTRHWWKK